MFTVCWGNWNIIPHAGTLHMTCTVICYEIIVNIWRSYGGNWPFFAGMHRIWWCQSPKDAVYFWVEDNHETIARRGKVLKNCRLKHELKITFLFNFYAKLRRLKRLGKTVGQAVIPGNFKRRYKRSSYDSGVLFYWLTVHTRILEWFSRRTGTSFQNGARSKNVDKKLARERRRVVLNSDLAVVATRILTSAF